MRSLKDALVRPDNVGEQIELTTEQRWTELLERIAKLERELRKVKDALTLVRPLPQEI